MWFLLTFFGLILLKKVVYSWSDTVLLNIPTSTFATWDIAYNELYNHYTTSSNLQAVPCDNNNTMIFVGAINLASPTIIVIGAYAFCDVLYTTTTSTSQGYLPNYTLFGYPNYNIYWYKYPSRSFGFSNTQSVQLSTADVQSGDKKLSWHLDQNYGGYRASSTKGLNDATNWRKVIYFRSTLTPTLVTAIPTQIPSNIPTNIPTEIPTNNPSNPTNIPTNIPTKIPTINPTMKPTNNPAIALIIDEIECCQDKIECQLKNIAGQQTKKIKCCKNHMCLNTIFNLIEPFSETFEFEVEKLGFNNGKINATNVIKSVCKESGCINSEFNYICSINKNGCIFECDGDYSCKNIIINIEYNNYINCKGIQSCINAQFILNKILTNNNQYKINCIGIHSCKDAKFILNLNKDDTIIFMFEELNAGTNTLIEINDISGSGININFYVYCKKDNSCQNLIINTGIGVNLLNQNILYCEQNACSNVLINGATALISNNNNKNDLIKLSSTKLILIFSLLSILLIFIIVIIFLYIYKKHKLNKQIKYEKEIDNCINNNNNDDDNDNKNMQSNIIQNNENENETTVF